jgi:antitoxin ParD1/3/4
MFSMERSFDLGREQEDFIDEAVRTGRFETPEAVIRESLRLLQEQEAAEERFRAAIQKGIDAADRGELVDADEVFDRLERKYRAMAEQRKTG